MLNPQDVEITIYDPTPRGGMRVPSTSVAVTVFHRPSNLGITVGTERSQYANKEKAMQLLNTMVNNMQRYVEIT